MPPSWPGCCSASAFNPMKKLPFHPCQKGDRIFICMNGSIASGHFYPAVRAPLSMKVRAVNPDRSLRVYGFSGRGSNVRSWVVAKSIHP